MATKYIRADGSGNDSSSGDDYANAWATVDKIYTYLNASGVKGDTFNLVNDGTHAMPTLATQTTKSLLGTDYDTDPGFVIRGTDSSGDPALTTVAGPAAGAVFMFLRTNVQYVSIKGLYLDMSTVGVANQASIVRLMDNGSGPVRFQACHVKGFTDNNANYGDVRRTIFEYSSGTATNTWGEISYSIVQNCPRPAEWADFGSYSSAVAHHCVVMIKGEFNSTETNAWLFPTIASASHDLGFYQNTLYYDLSDTTGSIAGLLSAQVASGDYGTTNWYNNAIWLNSASTDPAVVASVFKGSAGSTATFSGDVKSNVIQFGPDIVAGDVTAVYEDPWVGGLDTIGYEVAAATLFNDPDTAYTWEDVNGLGYDLTVPADLRLLLYKTNGRFGTLPGALPLVGSATGGDDDTDAGGGDPDNEDTWPYIDVRPFYAPVLEYNLNARLSTKRNRTRKHYLRKDIEKKGFREWTSRRIPLGVSTTKRIISGIETAEIILMEADEPVALNASTTEDVYLPAAEMVLVVGGEYEYVKIKNTSSTNTANTLLVAAD